MGIKVELRDKSKQKFNHINKGMRDAFVDVVLDVKRVSSESAPHKTGYLENNRYHVNMSTRGLEGYVGFEARSKRGFDYADWTHEKKYNLGEKSKAKRGGRSKYGGGVIPVGTGYLRNTVERNREGYLNHLGTSYSEAIRK